MVSFNFVWKFLNFIRYGLDFQRHMSWYFFFMFNDLRRLLTVRFVVIGGSYDLSSLTIQSNLSMQSLTSIKQSLIIKDHICLLLSLKIYYEFNLSYIATCSLSQR